MPARCGSKRCGIRALPPPEARDTHRPGWGGLCAHCAFLLGPGALSQSLSPQPGGRSVTRPPGLQSQVPGGLSGPFLSPQVGTAVGSARTFATVGELLCRIVPVCGARGGPAATPSKSAPVGYHGPEACCRAPRLRGRPTDTRAGLARL